MPAHPQSTWSSNGAGRGNLFVDADPDLEGIDPVTMPTTMSVTARRGRGLVVQSSKPQRRPRTGLVRGTPRASRARDRAPSARCGACAITRWPVTAPPSGYSRHS
jgi:hypothetical protein